MKENKKCPECGHSVIHYNLGHPCTKEGCECTPPPSNWDKMAIVDSAAPSGELDARAVVKDLARELYDRFVMGGWLPEETYSYIEGWLSRETSSLRHDRDKVRSLLDEDSKEWRKSLLLTLNRFIENPEGDSPRFQERVINSAQIVLDKIRETSSVRGELDAPTVEDDESHIDCQAVASSLAREELHMCDDIKLDQPLAACVAELQRARALAESSLLRAREERDRLQDSYTTEVSLHNKTLDEKAALSEQIQKAIEVIPGSMGGYVTAGLNILQKALRGQPVRSLSEREEGWQAWRESLTKLATQSDTLNYMTLLAAGPAHLESRTGEKKA